MIRPPFWVRVLLEVFLSQKTLYEQARHVFEVFGALLPTNTAVPERVSARSKKLFLVLSPHPGGKATAGCNKGRVLSKVP